jgi:carbonic anhydrase
MSNIQAGTRGLSAGDWIRLKRIQGTRPNPLPTAINVSIPGNAPPTDSAPATAFVLACIDPRFASALEAYLAEELAQVGFYTYDLFILAGASLGGNLTSTGTPDGPPNTNGECAVVSPPDSNWQSTLLDHIQVAITLHSVSYFYVVDHLLCGAFSVCNNAGSDSVPGPHEIQYDALKATVQGASFIVNGTPTSGATVFPDGNWQGLYFDVPVGSQTSLRDYTGAQQFIEYFPPTSTAKVLVLGCIDPRFNATLTSFLVNYKDVQFIYDLFILAGASLGANQSYNLDGTVRTDGTTGDAYPYNALADGTAGIGNLGRQWGPTFFDHLSIARFLHQITEVWVFDHLDCGAYKFIKLNNGVLNPLPSDNDPAPHITELRKLQASIDTYTSITDYLTNPPTHLSFKGFILDLQGTITKVVDDGTGLKLGPIKPPGSSRIRNPASGNTDSLAFNSADFVTQSQTGAGTPSLTVTRLCACYPSRLDTKSGICVKCKNGNIA